jgi:ubiquinone/menaquinone biosynthesis C-methylase UbiE
MEPSKEMTLSELDKIIIKSVEAKRAGSSWTPGEPDKQTHEFRETARAVLGPGADTAIDHWATVQFLMLAQLYRESNEHIVKKLDAPESVCRDLLNLISRFRHLADPQFLAQAYTLRSCFQGVNLPDPTIELGLGHGELANVILDDSRWCVGSTPMPDVLAHARDTYGNHQHYFAIDAAQIPFDDALFGSAVATFTVYHFEDKRRALSEVYRALRPGGTFAFNVINSAAFQEGRLSLEILRSLGLPDIARRVQQFVLTDFGGDDHAITVDTYMELLTELGFENVTVRPFLSSPLHRLMYLMRDAEILFGTHYRWALDRDPIRNVYATFICDVIAPLVHHDRSLSLEYGGTHFFITSQKPGALGAAPDISAVIAGLRCPETYKPLSLRGNRFATSDGAKVYPTYRGMGLLMPVYADLWRKQKDPAAEFDL